MKINEKDLISDDFKIVCKKCGSNNIKIDIDVVTNIDVQQSSGYPHTEHDIVDVTHSTSLSGTVQCSHCFSTHYVSKYD